MSADREMLELAAKAAGAKMSDYSDRTPDHWQIQHADRIWREWSPLADDGDALRLVMKLSLLVLPYPDNNAVRVTRIGLRDSIVSFGTPPDACAAARRAIVLAAADIGRALP